MKIAVGISGASGCILGLRLLEILDKTQHEIHAVISDAAKLTLKKESNICVDFTKFKNINFYDNFMLDAPISSGSFGIEKTIVAPCSINTLAKISNSISDTLITRMCAVALKEQKKLILSVREMPFSPISLRQMSELSALGVSIAPPIMGFYSGASNVNEMIDFIVGKWLDLLNIKHDIYKRWGSD